MSIKLGLVLEPEIQRCLDTRCVGLSTERPTLFAAEGLIRYETDTQRFVYYTHGPGWIPLFNAIQTDPYVLGLVDSVGQDLTEIHRRLNDYAADRTNTQETFNRVFSTLNEMHERVEALVGRINAIENFQAELHQRIENGLNDAYTRLDFIDARNAQMKTTLDDVETRLIHMENAHNNNDNNDINNNDDPPLAVI